MKLIIDGVSKRYKGNVWGLRDFSLQLEPGVLALVGPNRAGKSTLMRILATITKPAGLSTTMSTKGAAHAPADTALTLVMVGLTNHYNICRRPDTISVEKDRLEDGPFYVCRILSSSDDSESLIWYTGHTLRSTVAEVRSSLAPRVHLQRRG